LICAPTILHAPADEDTRLDGMSGRPPFVHANMLLFEERPCASVDPNIEQLVVVGAGIGRGGTVAAGEFLVDENGWTRYSSRCPAIGIERTWKSFSKHKSLEIAPAPRT